MSLHAEAVFQRPREAWGRHQLESRELLKERRSPVDIIAIATGRSFRDTQRMARRRSSPVWSGRLVIEAAGRA